MKRTYCYLVVAILLIISLYGYGQPGVSAAHKMKEEKEKFIHTLKRTTGDSAIIYPISRYFESEMNDIYASLNSERKFSGEQKNKALRSIVYFMNELQKNIVQQKMGLYDIPRAIHAYNGILKALIRNKPVAPLLKDLDAQCSQLMAIAFTQYKEFPLMDDIAIYKRVSSSPEFILQFLENRPDFRYADSLLNDAAAHDPLKISYYLNSNRPGVQDKIRSTSNIYLKQIATLSEDKNASELLPFVVQIAENKISREEILENRIETIKYFQLLVNTLQESKTSGTATNVYVKPLRNGIRQKALAFYVNTINDLHNSSDAVRFASVKGLRAVDLYYIITTCGEELYTSSYLGLYKRLMQNFKDQQADSLFDLVQYDNFRSFMRLAANYNVLVDFFQHTSKDKTKEILDRLISGIEKNESTALEYAMDIADSFAALYGADEICDMMEEELKTNLLRCKSSRNYLGVRLYSILSNMLGMVRQTDGIKSLWTTLGDYELLKRKSLENAKGEISELVLFYGDSDGIASFNNFLKFYADTKKWKIERNENWVSITSTSEHPLIIYANLPLEAKDELDIKAQDNLIAYLKEQSIEPTLIVHRGHSYHLDKTLRRLTPSVKLAILGSCGGYNKAISIASINPDVQVIGSKKTGSRSINDPFLYMINETLVNKTDLAWPEIWKEMTVRFSKDEGTLNLFNEYFPPSNNLGLFVLKLFNYYN
jgi:hypothetical protein